MSKKSTSRPAWGPWTFKGVAGFAQRPLKRLLVMEFIVAGIVAACAMVFVSLAWLPALDQAVRKLPTGGMITQSRLHWTGMLPQQLTQSRFLGIVVVQRGHLEVGQTADVQIELGPARWKVRSLLGYQDFAYPAGWQIALNRQEVEPWWGARRPFAVALVGVGTWLLMPLLWAFIAALYVPAVWLLAWFGNRDLSLWSGWKLASAALMPGALLMSVVLLLYAFQRLPLAVVLGAMGVHLALGWVYLLVAPFRLPKESKKRNDFSEDPPPKKRNPFG